MIELMVIVCEVYVLLGGARSRVLDLMTRVGNNVTHLLALSHRASCDQHAFRPTRTYTLESAAGHSGRGLKPIQLDWTAGCRRLITGLLKQRSHFFQLSYQTAFFAVFKSSRTLCSLPGAPSTPSPDASSPLLMRIIAERLEFMVVHPKRPRHARFRMGARARAH